MTNETEALKFLEPSSNLSPEPAAVALIVDEFGRYLVQLRDESSKIFFPNHWGCFGGALEAGESFEAALERELHEEIALDVKKFGVKEFTRFSFDFGFAGGNVIDRVFFEISITADTFNYLNLNEGKDLKLWDPTELLSELVVPYDRFAIWMHLYRNRFSLP